MNAASVGRRLLQFAVVLACTIPSASSAQTLEQAGWHLERATLADGATPRPNAIALVSGIAYKPDVKLRDGELRFVLAPPAGQFAGVAFRMACRRLPRRRQASRPPHPARARPDRRRHRLLGDPRSVQAAVGIARPVGRRKRP